MCLNSPLKFCPNLQGSFRPTGIGLTATARETEYEVSTSPTEKITNHFIFKQNLMTGTYKLVYKLYDGDVYVGEAFDYLVIK